MKRKLILKGSLYGVNIIKKYPNPDILYSVINKKIYQNNELHISFDKTFFIYFSYTRYDDDYNIIWRGRSYDTNYIFKKKDFNEKKLSLTIKINNMKIIIYFSQKAYNKLKNFI